jgi:peptidoglycan L-alanyl-D-glutamate endopeptidase CwlK
VSTPTESAKARLSPSTTTVTTPTTPRRAHAAPAKAPPAPSQTLVPGDTGSQVEILQRALAALGFSPGKPDGGYGFATQTAVARFQLSKGLLNDGVVGPQTLAALQYALSRRSQR